MFCFVPHVRESFLDEDDEGRFTPCGGCRSLIHPFSLFPQPLCLFITPLFSCHHVLQSLCFRKVRSWSYCASLRRQMLQIASSLRACLFHWRCFLYPSPTHFTHSFPLPDWLRRCGRPGLRCCAALRKSSLRRGGRHLELDP